MKPLSSSNPARGFDAPPSKAPWWWLLLPCLAGLFALLLFCEPLRRFLFFPTFPLGFDAFAILAALDANRLGLDVTGGNPLDSLDRPHVYSSWWFYLQYLGLGRANLLGFYLTSVGLFLIPSLVQFRPRNGREFFWLLSFLASLPVLLCVHRGNNDLIVFGFLFFVVPCLQSRSLVIRFLAPVLIVFATGLKYYPAIALTLLFVPECPRERGRLLVFAALLMALLVLGFSQDFSIGTHLAVVNDARGFLAVGASLLFSGFSAPGLLHKVLAAGLGLSVVALSWRLRGLGGWTRASAGDRTYQWFLLGASLYAGSYWLISNWAYRLVFMLWLIPFLLAPPAGGLMPRLLHVSTIWIRRLTLLLFWAPLLVLCLSALLRQPLDGVICGPVVWLLQLGYAVLAVYCTALVADLVFERLRAWRRAASAV